MYLCVSYRHWLFRETFRKNFRQISGKLQYKSGWSYIKCIYLEKSIKKNKWNKHKTSKAMGIHILHLMFIFIFLQGTFISSFSEWHIKSMHTVWGCHLNETTGFSDSFFYASRMIYSRFHAQICNSIRKWNYVKALLFAIGIRIFEIFNENKKPFKIVSINPIRFRKFITFNEPDRNFANSNIVSYKKPNHRHRKMTVAFMKMRHDTYGQSTPKPEKPANDN